MKAEIIYSQFVKIDLKEINQWYNKIDKRLWNFFLKGFRLKINYIRENPLALEVKYDVNRIAFLKKFPYAIHYQFDETENNVKVLAVFHTSRNPENWKERK
ncbi:type II toxin-antitoxin system RelE/ParE family toxin [Chryseobacterium sp. 09-1422]|uniref:Type II toxin-antitoxin system RelE/ParE family toxin n=1 Tax=Chryseobacterium kimseyorum TaxID=2984028 RepID=A0ABT3HZK5_9FLAO|nr:type II toxin-antitoxin system RelE/ParE family toxin [Chryseobacterium kimseyorum]MCW3169130.1 type II toxin-antitoxin system RelE/ParE family toxin [Chryseobacterium kimseyorum]